MYPHPDRITCVGTEDGSHLTALYPGVRYLRVAPGQPLPFADREFDIVVSNAVVEHTGGPASQRQFIREALRVSNGFFITTPNRWFPVEVHTGLPLLHYLPAPAFRWLIAGTRYRYWADEGHLNLLDARAFRELFPQDTHVEVRRVRLAGLTSNLVALSWRKGERR
jgi:SAM-dependent methyltransferase